MRHRPGADDDSPSRHLLKSDAPLPDILGFYIELPGEMDDFSIRSLSMSRRVCKITISTVIQDINSKLLPPLYIIAADASLRADFDTSLSTISVTCLQ